jgi:hypothetical protein
MHVLQLMAGWHQWYVRYYRPLSKTWTSISWPVPGASMVSAFLEDNGVPYIYMTAREFDLPNGVELTDRLVRVPIHIT